jgi:hypothetical protein
MADLLSDTGAATRAADTLLRGTGGRAVTLRLPAPAAAGDAGQLGLAAPGFEDVELAPVVFRSPEGAQNKSQNKPQRRELLVSATAAAALAGSLGYGAAEALFAAAFGVLVDGVLLSIESTTVAEAAGSAYLYRLSLRVPATEEI